MPYCHPCPPPAPLPTVLPPPPEPLAPPREALDMAIDQLARAASRQSLYLMRRALARKDPAEAAFFRRHACDLWPDCALLDT